MLKIVFGKRGPNENLLIYIKSPVNKDFSIEGELTNDISKINDLIIKTHKNEIPNAFSHSKNDFLCVVFLLNEIN